ncbi:ATP-binding response regulator [Edaphobacter aggregans]|uniref:ATP-binding response regulator n=1 Tax=Edaphobacter aggregans TaxID=570835 RepID=UPI0005516F4D|nr:ATP-binding protein [Edaphobacter aggregans]
MSRILVIGSDNPVTHSIGDILAASGLPIEYAAGPVGALQRMRMQSFAIAITSPGTTLEEDLALLDEMRHIRPAIKCISLAPSSTPDEVIAALRAHVFACFTAPFDPESIAAIARDAASSDPREDDIQVLSARPGWVSVRANCQILTAERLMTFARELSTQMEEDMRQELLHGLREILLNAIEHGAAFNSQQRIDVTAIRTSRAFVFYVRDPGSGFRQESLSPNIIAQPGSDPIEHIQKREEEGLRPGGFGLLLAKGTVDELLYNEIGNEVLLIKHLDRTPEVQITEAQSTKSQGHEAQGQAQVH